MILAYMSRAMILEFDNFLEQSKEHFEGPFLLYFFGVFNRGRDG